MRAYLPMTIDGVRNFYLQKSCVPEIVYAPTIKFITANPELDDEEAEYEISMIAARASGGFVIAVELAEKEVSQHNEETIEILHEIIWDRVEALFVYDSVEDELTWYATQEVGDYLQSVGNK
ncbi:MAG: hypothetical protein F2918_03540 [Actinobacteria bacterium]|uniref:Unannotated protein n=1 Tax=freshwater metagenome TaxID=449393 RepID=A0A6J6ANE3_9ZZZZ|nr:hypothetical protein [Actinomycetota bacterium]